MLFLWPVTARSENALSFFVRPPVSADHGCPATFGTAASHILASNIGYLIAGVPEAFWPKEGFSAPKMLSLRSNNRACVMREKATIE